MIRFSVITSTKIERQEAIHTDCPLDDIPSHKYRLVLTQSMNTVDGLLLNGLVPPCVHHEHV